MLKKPLFLLGIFLIVVAIGYFVGAGVAYSKAQGGYDSLQSFSEAQNVELSYNEDGQLVDRDTVEGAQAIMSLLQDDWGFPVVDADLDPADRPAFPREQPGIPTGAHWKIPEQQPVHGASRERSGE